MKHIAEIAADWAPRLNLSPALIAEYLTENVDYTLDADNLEGLRLFYKYGVECGVFPRVPELAFLEQRISDPAVRL
jgi:chorismate dehydratase